MPNVLTIAFDGADSEALILTLRDMVAISNGSACTSAEYKPSHVLRSMGLETEVVTGAIRLSWSHLAAPVQWREVAARISDIASDDMRCEPGNSSFGIRATQR